jgi:hypothetical protein
MRIPVNALLLTGGAMLLGCNESAQGPTQPMSVATDGTTLAAKLGKGKDDVVTGAGTSTLLRFSFEVSARSGPVGENPKGHLMVDITARDGGPFYQGKVTCVAVVGNRAAVGIEHPDFAGKAFFSSWKTTGA